MTDKAFKRANQIKEEMSRLDAIKRELKKCVHICINVTLVECIRNPFIEAVDGEITKLREEYERL